MKTTVQQVIHYDKDDKEFVYDYHSIDLLVDDKKVVSYGDYCHDSGREKAIGFVDALKFVYGKNNVEVLDVIRIADGIC